MPFRDGINASHHNVLAIFANITYAIGLCCGFGLVMFGLGVEGRFLHIHVIFASQIDHGFTHDDVIKWKYFPRYCPFVRLKKRLSKQSWGWWFEMLLRSLWRHYDALGQALRWSIPPESLTKWSDTNTHQNRANNRLILSRYKLAHLWPRDIKCDQLALLKR